MSVKSVVTSGIESLSPLAKGKAPTAKTSADFTALAGMPAGYKVGSAIGDAAIGLLLGEAGGRVGLSAPKLVGAAALNIGISEGILTLLPSNHSVKSG